MEKRQAAVSRVRVYKISTHPGEGLRVCAAWSAEAAAGEAPAGRDDTGRMMQTRAKSAMVRIRLGFSNSRPTCATDLETPRTPHLSPTPVLVDFAVEAGRVPEQQARRGSLLFDAAFQQKSLETNSIVENDPLALSSRSELEKRRVEPPLSHGAAPLLREVAHGPQGEHLETQHVLRSCVFDSTRP